MRPNSYKVTLISAQIGQFSGTSTKTLLMFYANIIHVLDIQKCSQNPLNFT